MKKQIVISIIAALMMFVGAYNSNSEMRGYKGIPGDVEEGKPMMQPMRHAGPGIMEVMPEVEHPVWQHLMSLGLDEKQREAIKEIKSRLMKEMIKKNADEHISGIELTDLLDKDIVDMKAVVAKLKQIETLKTEIHLSLIRAIEETKSKLTPEQRNKFKELREIDPDMGPPMIGCMMRGDMRMPPPCDNKKEMRQEMERLRP